MQKLFFEITSFWINLSWPMPFSNVSGYSEDFVQNWRSWPYSKELTLKPTNFWMQFIYKSVHKEPNHENTINISNKWVLGWYCVKLRVYRNWYIVSPSLLWNGLSLFHCSWHKTTLAMIFNIWVAFPSCSLKAIVSSINTEYRHLTITFGRSRVVTSISIRPCAWNWEKRHLSCTRLNAWAQTCIVKKAIFVLLTICFINSR